VKYQPERRSAHAARHAGVPGNDNSHFNAPSDVVVAPNGDIFVADGHDPATNNRVVKFDTNGTFVKAWGRPGEAPGEFHALHCDRDGFAGPRVRRRPLQQPHPAVRSRRHFTSLAGRSSAGRAASFFDHLGRILVADSESDDIENPGWDMGIRIGDAATGAVHEFILYPWGDPRVRAGNGAEFAVVDRDGNIYGGEPRPRRLQKYVRVRP
jgi:hypothetical protein